MRKMTAIAKRALSYFRPAPSDRETAALALFAPDWDSDLAREVGSRLLNWPPSFFTSRTWIGANTSFPCAISNKIRANPTRPNVRSGSREGANRSISSVRSDGRDAPVSAIAKPDTRGFRTPPCLAGLACSDIILMGCETHVADPLARLRQAYRQVASPLPLGRPMFGSGRAPYFQNIIYPYERIRAMAQQSSWVASIFATSSTLPRSLTSSQALTNAMPYLTQAGSRRRQRASPANQSSGYSPPIWRINQIGRFWHAPMRKI